MRSGSFQRCRPLTSAHGKKSGSAHRRLPKPRKVSRLCPLPKPRSRRVPTYRHLRCPRQAEPALSHSKHLRLQGPHCKHCSSSDEQTSKACHTDPRLQLGPLEAEPRRFCILPHDIIPNQRGGHEESPLCFPYHIIVSVMTLLRTLRTRTVDVDRRRYNCSTCYSDSTQYLMNLDVVSFVRPDMTCFTIYVRTIVILFGQPAALASLTSYDTIT